MKAIINNQALPLQIMSTHNSKSVGMMGRDNLPGGMLFPFNEISERSFWMKNCNIPLDILFISGNKINHISHNCPPCKTDYCPHYQGVGDKVLELNGGYCEENNIEVGDIINFD